MPILLLSEIQRGWSSLAKAIHRERERKREGEREREREMEPGSRPSSPTAERRYSQPLLLPCFLSHLTASQRTTLENTGLKQATRSFPVNYFLRLLATDLHPGTSDSPSYQLPTLSAPMKPWLTATSSGG